MNNQNLQGTIYLLHFSGKVSDHAQHYLGWAIDADKRVRQHINGHAKASPLVLAAKAEGFKITLAATWPGTRADERRLKTAGHFPERLCPICKEKK